MGDKKQKSQKSTRWLFPIGLLYVQEKEYEITKIETAMISSMSLSYEDIVELILAGLKAKGLEIPLDVESRKEMKFKWTGLEDEEELDVEIEWPESKPSKGGPKKDKK